LVGLVDVRALDPEFLSNLNLLSNLHIYRARVEMFSGCSREHISIRGHPLLEMPAAFYYLSPESHLNSVPESVIKRMMGDGTNEA